MSKPAAVLALPAKHASRAAFDRAAATFATSSVVHDFARERLLERLAYVRVNPAVVVDLGCATGRGADELARRFPAARVVALDSSIAMLAASAPAAGGNAPLRVGGDVERLPLKSGAAAFLFANLVLPWTRPDLFFREAARVLEPGGLCTFATVGPDTLMEVRRAWAKADDRIHVHAAFEMHDLGDLATAAGLAEPVLDVERIVLTYTDVADLVRDLRASGGVNTAAGRRATLTGTARWRAFAQALHAGRRGERFAVTVELIFGMAWGSTASRARSSGEIVVPLERLKRRPA